MEVSLRGGKAEDANDERCTLPRKDGRQMPILLGMIRHAEGGDEVRTDWRTVVNGVIIAIFLAIVGALMTFATTDRNRISELQARNVERIAVLEQRVAQAEAENRRARDRVDALEQQVLNLHRTIIDQPRRKEP